MWVRFVFQNRQLCGSEFVGKMRREGRIIDPLPTKTGFTSSFLVVPRKGRLYNPAR